MFDELDDPAPQLRPEQVLPQVRARGAALRRRRRLAAAGGAGTALAVVGALVFALPTGGRSNDALVPATTPASQTPSPTPSATASPVPTTAPTQEATRAPVVRSPEPTDEPVPTVSPTGPAPSPEVFEPSGPPTVDRLELRGDDLAVTRIGDSRASAVAAVSAVLGPPSEDPSSLTRCVGSMQEVAWQEFTLAFDEADRLVGWSSRDPSLRTPSGVTVGTTVARLREVYGARLRLYPPNPDHGDSYGVEGVSMVGGLSGPGDDDRVRSLTNGACTGP